MGENDAWLVATAQTIGADVVWVPTARRSSGWARVMCVIDERQHELHRRAGEILAARPVALAAPRDPRISSGDWVIW